MPSKEKSEQLIFELYNAVVNMDDEVSKKVSLEILAEKVDVNEAITKGLTAAMQRVGELYTNYEYFVPELLLCSDALYAGLEILKPHIYINEGKTEVKKQIILGVIEGDIHNIGKNLVKIMFDSSGWIVHDLGDDVKLERFVEEQQQTQADVIGISALMTTSMLAMPRLIKMLKSKNPKTTVLVGGAPLSMEVARQYGADGYASNAATAVQEANRLINRMLVSKN